MELLSHVHPGLLLLCGVAAAFCLQWVFWGRTARRRLDVDGVLRDLAAGNPQFEASMSYEDRESLRKLMLMFDELRMGRGRFEQVCDRWAYQIPSLKNMGEDGKERFKEHYEGMRRKPMLRLHYRVVLLLAPIVMVVAGLCPYFITGVQCVWLAAGLLLGSVLWFCRHPNVL